MNKLDDFCVFILTHGRPNNVITVDTLKRHGYTGKYYIVIDDEDDKTDEYFKVYGEKVIVFSKEEIAKTFDEGDNFNDRRAIIYARNACFELAETVGCTYFMQLDDDYKDFNYRFNDLGVYGNWYIKNLNAVIGILLDYYKAIPALSIAMAQGGDYIGGKECKSARNIMTKRKDMNTFICSTERPFKFFGRINEDVNTYTNLARRGGLFLTVCNIMMNQLQTQANAGGMTDIYLDSGTYVKSFYSVMYSPSCVKINEMGNHHGKNQKRLHHQVKWNAAAPKIIKEEHKRIPDGQ